MDRILSRFFELENAGAKLILATALSQQPYLKYESSGGHIFYRLNNVEGLFELLGAKPNSIKPTMTHQYLVNFASGDARDRAASMLQDITLDDKIVLEVVKDKDESLYFGCQIRTPVGSDTTLSLSSNPSSRSLKFFELFYQLDSVKSGCHHPDGALWFKTGSHKKHYSKASILDIFPTVLDYFDIDPSTCSIGQPGHSLISRMTTS